MPNLTVGSRIRLKNVALGGYLDTCGRVQDVPAVVGSGKGVDLVQTSTAADRDKGSGTWIIVSTNGSPDGSPIDNNSQVHLRNAYSGAGHLALLDKVGEAEAGILDSLESGWGNSNRRVQTVRTLDGDLKKPVGAASFALQVVPKPADHASSPLSPGARVRVQCYDQDKNYLLRAFGPLSAFTFLGVTYPVSQNGLVFATPNVPADDRSLWEISLAP